MEYIGRIEMDKQLRVNETKIVVFGAGKGLSPLLDKLEEMGIKNQIVCICDNNQEQQGKEMRGIKVYCLDDAIQYYEDVVFLVYNRFCKEICKQLIRKGITKIHLIRS